MVRGQWSVVGKSGDGEEFGFGLLAGVGARDVEGGGGVGVGAAVGGEPGLAAGEEVVEVGGGHGFGEVGVAADGNDAAEGVAFFDGDAFL